MKKKKSRKDKTKQALLIAFLLSLLVHQLFMSSLGSLFSFPEEQEPEKQYEVSLLPDIPEEKQAVEEKEKPIEQPVSKPSTKSIKKPMPTVSNSNTNLSETESVRTENHRQDSSDTTKIPNSVPDSVESLPPKLDLTWKSFEKVFGDKAAQDRNTYAEDMLEKRRNRGAIANYSDRVMKAVTNHRSFIKPGEQEVLGSRKEIFHNYIHAIHEASVHPKFADTFLASLPSLSVSDPLNNMDLHMVAEFEIFESGHISDIRVVKTSGNIIFDAGAVDSIFRSSPFPAPPKEVLSWNKRVYLRWGFYRNNRKCGVFNVEPYILRAPGSKEEALPVDQFTVQGS